MSQNNCSSCASGYTLGGNGTMCTPICNATNCYACNAINNVCMTCNPGYTLTNGQCTPLNFSCLPGCVNTTNSCVYNWNTGKGECTQCMPGNLLYNGQCYSSTCNIQNCTMCSPWDAANTNCLRCAQSFTLYDGYCMPANCADSTPFCGQCI